MKLSYSLKRTDRSIIILVRATGPRYEYVSQRALDIHDVLSYYRPWRYVLHVLRQMRWALTAYVKENEDVTARLE